MKIHIHTPSFFPMLVGMTYATHVHALLLRELGADVTIITPTTDGAPFAEEGDYKIRRFDASGSGLPWSPLRGDLDGILRFTAEDRPDIVIAEGWFTTGAALLPRLKPLCRHVVLSSHGSADLTLKAPTPAQIVRLLSYRWVERREQKRVASVVSAAILLTSYRDRDRFRDAAVFQRRNVPAYICPNPSTYAASPIPRDGRQRHAILHVGELTSHKNQLLAVRTLARLPYPFRLTLACPRWTAYGDEVMAIAETLGVRDRITIVEGKDRAALEAVFDAHDLLLITSRSEAQPIIAADALRKGMPFVSTPVGCMPEFGGGLISRPAKLDTAITGICADAASYTGYAREAVAYYDGHLARDRSLAALRSMISGLCAA